MLVDACQSDGVLGARLSAGTVKHVDAAGEEHTHFGNGTKLVRSQPTPPFSPFWGHFWTSPHVFRSFIPPGAPCGVYSA